MIVGLKRGASGLASLAVHLPPQAVRTFAELPAPYQRDLLRRAGLGEYKDSRLVRALPWIVGGVCAFVGWRVWRDLRG
jgi:hypothetical protein